MAPTTDQKQSAPARPPRQRQAAPSPRSSDQAETEVLRRAAEVLGDKSAAMRWLGTPIQALDYATPISLLHDSKGLEDVLTVLGRMAHGIY